VLAGCGVPVTMSDLFGVAGSDLLDRVELPAAFRARIDSAGRILACLDGEIEAFSAQLSTQLRGDPRYRVLQTVPGIGPVLAAVFLAEIADVTRFAGPAQLTSWAGLTPKHRESDLQVHRGRITKQGSRLVRWAAIEAVQRVGEHTRIGRVRQRVAARRGRNVGVVAAARELLTLVFYALRDGHVRCLQPA
jgi:transposase